MPSSLSLPPRAARAEFKALSSDKLSPATRLYVLALSAIGSWGLLCLAMVLVGF